MNKFYVLCLFVAIICGAYFCGLNMGIEKCRAKTAQKNAENIQQQYIQNNNNKRIIHDKVYKTGVGDVRRFLRDKYTIAE